MKKSASILDYSYPFLDPAVWDHEQKLYSYHKDFIIRLLESMYVNYKLVQPEAWITDIRIIGSLTTSKWLFTSDMDVHMVVNLTKFIELNMPGVDPKVAFDYLDSTRKEFDRAKILAPMTQHPIEYYFEIPEFVTTNTSMVGIYSLSQDKWLKDPVFFDADVDFEESKKQVMTEAESIAQALDGSFGKIDRQIDRISELERIITAWGNDKQQLFYNKVEEKLKTIEAEILKDLELRQALIDARHAAQNPMADIEIKFKWLQRFGFFGILTNLKNLMTESGGKITPQELPLLKKIVTDSALKEAFIKEAFEKDTQTDICVDLDKTIAKPAKFPEIGEPIEGAKEALKRLQDLGYNVIIYSCRADEKDGLDSIKKYLDKYDIPYDSIFEGEKPFAKFYIDDHAIRFDNWDNVLKQVEKSEKKASLHITAKLNQKYWIDPSGKEFPLNGSDAHGTWISNNRKLLEGYGFEYPDEYWQKSQGVFEIADNMLRHDWTRITTESDYDFAIEVRDINYLPSYLDNFIATHYTGGGVEIDDLTGEYQDVEDPFPSLQKQINRAKRTRLQPAAKAFSKKEIKAAFAGEGFWIAPDGKIFRAPNTHYGWIFDNITKLTAYGLPTKPLIDAIKKAQVAEDDVLWEKAGKLQEQMWDIMIQNGWSRLGDTIAGYGLEIANIRAIPQSAIDAVMKLPRTSEDLPISDANNEYISIPIDALVTGGQKAVNETLQYQRLRGSKAFSKKEIKAHNYDVLGDPSLRQGPARAVFNFVQKGVPEMGLPDQDMFDILGDHPRYGSTVSRNTLQELNVPIAEDKVAKQAGNRVNVGKLSTEKGYVPVYVDKSILDKYVESIAALNKINPYGTGDYTPNIAKLDRQRTKAHDAAVASAFSYLKVNKDDFYWSVREIISDFAESIFSKKYSNLKQAGTKKIKQGDYSCIMASIPHGIAQEIVEFGVREIPDEDLYTDEDGNLGRELQAHVTIMYGLLTDDAKSVRRSFNHTKPFKAKLGKVRHFQPPERDFDVVTVEVISDDLYAANKMIEEKFDCTDDLPSSGEYKPHVTIAYVKRNAAKKHIGSDEFEGIEIELDTLVFSPRVGNKMHFSIGSNKKHASWDAPGYWVDPKGNIYDAHGDGLIHNEWVLSNLKLLRDQYGIRIPKELFKYAREYFKYIEEGGENADMPASDEVWNQMIQSGWVRVGDADEGIGIEVNDLHKIPSFMDNILAEDLHDGQMVRVEDINHVMISVQYPFKNLQQAVNQELVGQTKQADFLPSLFQAPDNKWQEAEGGDDKEIALNPDSVSDDQTAAEPCTTGKPRSKEVWRQFISMFSNLFSRKDTLKIEAYDPEMEEAEKHELGEDQTALEYSKDFTDLNLKKTPHNTTWDSLTQDGEPSKPTSVTYSPQISNEDNLDQNSPGGYPRRFMGKPKGEYFSNEGEVNNTLIQMLRNRTAMIEATTKDITKEAYLQHAYWIDPNGKIFQVRDDKNTSQTHWDWIYRHMNMLEKEYGLKNLDGISDLIRAGWVRIGDSSDPTQWQVEVNDLRAIPSAVDNVLAQFLSEGARVDFADKNDNFTTIKWPWKNVQTAVNKALHQALPMAASLKTALVKQYALYVNNMGYPAVRTMTYDEAVQFAKARFPEEVAKGAYQIREERMKVSSLNKDALNVDGVTVTKNPSTKQLEILIKKARYNELRGVINPDNGDLFVWDAYFSNHWPMIKALGIDIQDDNDYYKYTVTVDTHNIHDPLNLQQKIKSKFLKRASIERVDGVNVFVNPSQQELEGLATKLRKMQLGGTFFRGLIDPNTGDLFVWDAYYKTHEEMIEKLGIELKYSEGSQYVLWFQQEEISNILQRQQRIKQRLKKKHIKQAGSQSASVPDYLIDEWKTEQINNDTDEEPYVNHDQRDYPYGMHDSPENTGTGIGWPKDNTRAVVRLDTLENPSFRLDPFGIGEYNVTYYTGMPASDGIEQMNEE